jgi:hypothetical protein
MLVFCVHQIRRRPFPADSVIGVTLFGDSDPIEFGVFDRAFVTLFQITCGATWVANLPVYIHKNIGHLCALGLCLGHAFISRSFLILAGMLCHWHSMCRMHCTLQKNLKAPLPLHVQVVMQNGKVNGQLTAYIVTYVIVTNWVVLQVEYLFFSASRFTLQILDEASNISLNRS